MFGENMVFIPVVGLAVYLVAELLKAYLVKTDDQRKLLPTYCAILGALLGLVLWFVYPGDLNGMSPTAAIMNGAFSGFAATGCNQFYKQIRKYLSQDVTADDTTEDNTKDDDKVSK